MALLVAKVHISILALAMSNSDLTYDDTSRRFELNGATLMMLALGQSSRESFVNRLDDPAKYAAAHVALTKLIEFDPGVRKRNDDGKLEYLTLPFRHTISNGLDFEFSDSPPLKTYWRMYLPKYDAQGNYTLSGLLLFGELDIDEWQPKNAQFAR